MQMYKALYFDTLAELASRDYYDSIKYACMEFVDKYPARGATHVTRYTHICYHMRGGWLVHDRVPSSTFCIGEPT